MKRHRINSSFHYILVALMVLSFMLPFAVSDSKASAQAVTAGSKNGNLTDKLNKVSGPLWTVGSTVVVVVDSTRKEGFPMEGDMVNVRGQVQADGSILASRIRTLNLLRSKGKAAVTKPVVAPPVLPSVTETRFTGKVNGTGNNMWLIGTTPVAIDAKTIMQGNPASGLNVEVRGIQQKDGIVLATQIRNLGAGSGANAGIGTEVRFTATAEDVAATSWNIGGFTVTIDANTKMIDNPREGDSVDVIAVRQAGTTLLATEIRNQIGIAPAAGSGSSGSGSGSSGSGSSGSGSSGSGSGSSGSGSGSSSSGSGSSGSGSGSSSSGSGSSGSGSSGSGSGSSGSGSSGSGSSGSGSSGSGSGSSGSGSDD